MRLLVPVVALSCLSAAAATAQPGSFRKAQGALKAGCPPMPGKQYALDPGKPLKPQRLAELPPADAYQAVLRTDGNGCLDPLLVRDRVRSR